MTLTRNDLTLGDLMTRSGLDVLGHLEREMTIPVHDGLQAQGDLLVIPIGMLAAPGTYVIRRQREKSHRPNRLPSFIID